MNLFKWCNRFEESVDLILDNTGRGSKPNVTEKTLTLISEPLDKDRLLTFLLSMIRDSIRMCTNNVYIGTSNSLPFWGEYFDVVNN